MKQSWEMKASGGGRRHPSRASGETGPAVHEAS